MADWFRHGPDYGIDLDSVAAFGPPTPEKKTPDCALVLYFAAGGVIHVSPENVEAVLDALNKKCRAKKTNQPIPPPKERLTLQQLKAANVRDVNRHTE